MRIHSSSSSIIPTAAAIHELDEVQRSFHVSIGCHDVAHVFFLVMLVVVTAIATFASASATAAELNTLYRPGSDANNQDDDMHFGRAIDLDGSLLAVTSDEPAVYVFRLADGDLDHLATLRPPAYETGRFGEPVSIDGNVIAVADRRAGVDGLYEAGLVHVFERDRSDGDWRHSAVLHAPTPLEEGYFGTEVAVSGDRILVTSSAADVRRAYLYERDGTGNWTWTRTFMGEDGSGLDVIDSAIDDDRIAFTANGNGYIYEYGASGWLLADTVELGGAATVAIEGDVLVLGAPGENIGDRPRAEGVAYFFERDPDAWVQRARLNAPNDGNAHANFGVTVDIEDGLVLAGENHETGAIYAFLKDEAGEWTQFAQHVEGNLSYVYWDSAISAQALAMSFSEGAPARVLWYETSALIAEAGLENDESFDDPAGDEDENEGDDSNGSDDANEDDDTNPGGGGNDPGVTEADNDAASDGADEGSDDAGAGDGDDDTGGTGDASGNAEQADAAGGGSGGGALAWLLTFLMSLLGARRRFSQVENERRPWGPALGSDLELQHAMLQDLTLKALASKNRSQRAVRSVSHRGLLPLQRLVLVPEE